jgi:hypothetical protein
MKKIIQENKKLENLNLLLKQKEQEIRIAKQKAGFFARKHAETLEKLEKKVNVAPEKSRKSLHE